MPRSSRLFSHQCFVLLCGEVPVAVGGLWEGPPDLCQPLLTACLSSLCVLECASVGIHCGIHFLHLTVSNGSHYWVTHSRWDRYTGEYFLGTELPVREEFRVGSHICLNRWAEEEPRKLVKCHPSVFQLAKQSGPC